MHLRWPLPLVALGCALLTLTACERVHQLSLLQQARARYYDMETAGAKGFGCDVQPDWDTFFASATKGRATNSPWQVYLRAAHLTFTQPLRGEAQVTWMAPGTPPAGKEALATQMQQSFHSMVAGFLMAIKPNLNGTLLPAIPVHDFTPSGDGYQLVEQDLQGRQTLLTLDRALTLRHLSVHWPSLSLEMDTTYGPSPKGLLLLRMKEVIHQPPTAPANHAVLETTYASIDGFEVPSSLTVTNSEGVRIPMRFTACHVMR